MVAKKKNNATTKKVNVKAAKGRSAPAISVNRKEFLSQCVNHIATKLVQAKLPNGGTPRGVAEKLLQEGRSVFPNMTMNMINYAVKKLMVGGTKPKLVKSTVRIGQQTCVSS